MSLKDRLNKNQTPKKRNEIEQPKYYIDNNDAQNATLGFLDSLFIDDDINNIFVSDAKNIYIEKKGKIYKNTTTYRDNIQLENIAKKLIENKGLDTENNSIFKLNYKNGINITITLNPITKTPTMFIKCYKNAHSNLQKMQEDLSISKEIALVLEALCNISKNILIYGEKNSLKTTLLSSMAKKVPVNDNAIILDNENELNIDKFNLTIYNLSQAKIEDKNEVIKTILNSNINKIFINNNDDKLFANVINKKQNSNSNITITLNAKDNQDAIIEASRILSENTMNLTINEAKERILNTFDILIHVNKNANGRRKLISIAQINKSKNNLIENIFTSDNNWQHNSCGIIPEFYQDIKNNDLPMSDNLFDKEYKHTYCKNIEVENIQNKEKIKLNVLKKFKKEYQEENTSTNLENINSEETYKRAQEKLEELKKNAQMQENMEELIQKPVEDTSLIENNENI